MEVPVHCECHALVEGGGCYPGSSSQLTAFRMAEKRYKLYRYDRRTSRRMNVPATDFTDVVDFRDIAANTAANRACISLSEREEDGQSIRCCTFSGVPGMLVFPNFLNESEQQELCRAAVLEYGDSRRHPNHLSTHASEPRETTRYEPPMRWATVGFSYQWSSKSYRRDKYSHFPPLLQRCVERVARLCGASQDYEPQTSIVNYFPLGAMMMAHQDVSEEVLQQPLISISLGCSCVFLMGTESRDDTPCAFWLRSGDVVAFSGPCRTAYHGVPRIMDDCPPYLCQHSDVTGREIEGGEEEESENNRYWREHMQHLRVNINVRQVYPDGCKFLFE